VFVKAIKYGNTVYCDAKLIWRTDFQSWWSHMFPLHSI